MSKTKKGRSPAFVMLNRAMVKSESWYSLTSAERDVYIMLKANYNGKNNGEVRLTYKEMGVMMSRATFSKAIKGLIDKSWIEKTKQGGLTRWHSEYLLTGKHEPILKQ